MNLEKRLELIERTPVEEVVTRGELRELLQAKKKPVAYDGFEPSGLAHLASGLMRAQKVQDLVEAGIHFKAFIADWHGWINNKMGGDLDRIQSAGKYLIKVWETLGVDTKKVEVVWASELVESKDYWKTFILIGKNTSLKRMTRALTIMGRKEGELREVAQYFYPPMQVTDIFELGVDICQLGVDQRKANMLARDIGPKIGLWKPVVVSHHMLMGLQGPVKMGGYDEDSKVDVEISSKMSKSLPDTCVYVHDSESEIERKIRGAFCEAKNVERNPILEICRCIIFRDREKELKIERVKKFGGDVSYWNYGEVEKAFAAGELHPMDLKNAVARELNVLVKPCRNYFNKHPKYLEIFEGEITR
jgi:tyrosyl-tRNA synthetase